MTSTPPSAPEDPREPIAQPQPFASPGGSPSPDASEQSSWGTRATDIGYGQPQYGQYAPGHHPVPPNGPTPPVIAAPQYGYGGPGWKPIASKPGIIPLRPLSLGEIYDGAFAAIRKNPKVMLGLVALVISVATIIPALINVVAAPALNRWFDDQFQSFAESAGSTQSELGLDTLSGQLSLDLLMGIGLYFATIVTTGMLIVAVSRAVIGQSVTTGEVWAQVKSKIGGLILISLLPAVAISVLSALLLLVAMALMSVNAGLGILMFAAALIAGAFWLSIRFLLTPAAYVLEGQGLGTAIKRGWLISRGSFWRLLGIYLLSSIITTIVTALISSPGTILSGLFFSSDSSTDIGPTIMVVVTQILASTISTTFLSSVVALLYIDVRMRREGLDVELAAAANAV